MEIAFPKYYSKAEQESIVKACGGNGVLTKSNNNVLEIYEDKPLSEDAYNIMSSITYLLENNKYVHIRSPEDPPNHWRLWIKDDTGAYCLGQLKYVCPLVEDDLCPEVF